MNALVRSVARRTSIGLGGLALAVGAAACGAEDSQDPAPEQDPGVEDTAPEASDGGGGAEELSAEDLEAAKQGWVDFVHAIDEQDAAEACSYLLHPETGQTGEGDPECESALEEDVMPQIDAGEYAELDTSMIEAEDNGDGTVTVLLEEQPFPLPLVQGEDGDWYLTGPSY